MGWGGFNLPTEWFSNEPDIAGGGGIHLAGAKTFLTRDPYVKIITFEPVWRYIISDDSSRPYGGYNLSGGYWDWVKNLWVWLGVGIIILIAYLLFVGKLKI